MKENRESFSMFFFLQACYFSGEQFNSYKKLHVRLKPFETVSCVKFICERSKSMKATSAFNGGPLRASLKIDSHSVLNQF